jgi:hypothetical protein
MKYGAGDWIGHWKAGKNDISLRLKFAGINYSPDLQRNTDFQ